MKNIKIAVINKQKIEGFFQLCQDKGLTGKQGVIIPKTNVINLMLNDEVMVEDLLRGIIVVSGNDACVALAEGISGSEEEFVVLMNEKAEEIGMDNTNFCCEEK